MTQNDVSPESLPNALRALNSLFACIVHATDHHLHGDHSPFLSESILLEDITIHNSTSKLHGAIQAVGNARGHWGRSDCLHGQHSSHLTQDEQTGGLHIPFLLSFRSAQPGRSFASISSSWRPMGLATGAVRELSQSFSRAQEKLSSSRVRVESGSSGTSSSTSSSTTASTASARSGTSTAAATTTAEAVTRGSATTVTGTGIGTGTGAQTGAGLDLIPNVWQSLQHVAFPFLVEGGTVAATLIVSTSAAAIGALQPAKIAGTVLRKIKGALLDLQEKQHQDVDQVQKLLPVGILLTGKWKRPIKRREDHCSWCPQVLASILHSPPLALFPQVRLVRLPGAPEHKGVTGCNEQDTNLSTTTPANTGAEMSESGHSSETTGIKEPPASPISAVKKVECLRTECSSIAPPPGFSEPPESTQQLAMQIAASAEVSWSGFIRPVDKVWEISSRFGPRWGRNHNGVDLAAPTGEPVLAADAGRVTYAGWEPTGFGYLIEITHDDGWRTLYGHNSKLYAWTGKRVKRGECIALVGETGKATGPHLHWEIRKKDGFPVDPARYVPL